MNIYVYNLFQKYVINSYLKIAITIYEFVVQR